MRSTCPTFAPLLLIVLLGAFPQTPALAADSAFRVVVDPRFARPLLRLWPRKDRNGEVPRDVLTRFLNHVGAGEDDAAAQLCHFRRKGDGWPEEQGSAPITGERFGGICRYLRATVKEFTLSGSTVRQKSGYWSIEYRCRDAGGRQFEYLVYLRRDDGIWKISDRCIEVIEARLLELARPVR